MIHELVIALMLGLIGGMIPGPVITAVFTEVLQSGYLKKILAETSIDIPVNQVIAYLGDADDVVSDDMLRPTLAEPQREQPEATSIGLPRAKNGLGILHGS